jgi:superfamily I DNA/RNA helicase
VPTVDELVNASPDSHGVLIAGPGAGKSFQIGRRKDALLADHGVQPEDILILTLTNETKRTLRERFPTVPVRTVHAYALTTLNLLGATGSMRVADPWESDELVSYDIKRLLSRSGVVIDVRRIRKFMKARGAGFRDEQSDDEDLTSEEKMINSTWLDVREFLQLRLFEDFAPDLIRYLHEGRDLPRPPRSILVDEYQDLTPAELDLIHEVAIASGAGVFACGDDRQSIYGFRRAQPGALTSFPAAYGSEPPAYLSESRRCPALVIHMSEAVAAQLPVLAHSSARPAMTSLPALGDGEVRILALPSMTAETRWVVTDMLRRRPPQSNETLAVIAPRDLPQYVGLLNHASVEMNAGLTFKDSRTHLPLAKDLSFRLAYSLLRLATDGEHQPAWRTLLRVAPTVTDGRINSLFGLGEARLSIAIRQQAALVPVLHDLLELAQGTADQLAGDPGRQRAIDAIDWVADRLGLLRPSWAEISDQGRRVSSDQDEATEPEPADSWRALLEECGRVVYRTVAERDQGEDILVYTVYGAKGQQWQHVYVVGCYVHGFLDRGAVGEGGRKLYVAVTRSEWSLTITKPDYVNTPIFESIGTRSPGFPEILERARRARGIDVERPGPQVVRDLRGTDAP